LGRTGPSSRGRKETSILCHGSVLGYGEEIPENRENDINPHYNRREVEAVLLDALLHHGSN